MTNGKMLEGKCLCGAVSVRSPAITEVEACHCGMCRRWGGGPFLSVHGGPDVQIDGADSISAFSSSEWAERGFCKTCGTHIYYRLKESADYVIPVGLFDDQSGFVFREQIFIDRKPSYYDFANSTHLLTEKQVFEKFAPE